MRLVESNETHYTKLARVGIWCVCFGMHLLVSSLSSLNVLTLWTLKCDYVLFLKVKKKDVAWVDIVYFAASSVPECLSSLSMKLCLLYSVSVWIPSF